MKYATFLIVAMLLSTGCTTINQNSFSGLDHVVVLNEQNTPQTKYSLVDKTTGEVVADPVYDPVYQYDTNTISVLLKKKNHEVSLKTGEEFQEYECLVFDGNNVKIVKK